METEVVIAVVAVGSPFWALAVYAVGKVMLEGFQSADTQAVTERVSGQVPTQVPVVSK